MHSNFALARSLSIGNLLNW